VTRPRLAELLAADASLARAWSADGYTALHFSAFFGQPEAARLLLEAGADANVASRNAMAVLPLNSAAAGGHVGIARLLVDHGADVNARTHLGFTPLHAAAEHGDDELAALLIDRGADRSARTERGESPADAAARTGHHALAERLAEGTSR
jgi:uncharacterized protein